MKKGSFRRFLWVFIGIGIIPLGLYSNSLSSSVTTVLPIHRKIHELKVKSTLFDNSKLTLVALDSLGNEDPSVNGAYPIEINGFEQSLIFVLGRSTFPGNLKNSAFISLKPVSITGSKPSFYLLIQWGGGVYPQNIHVSWLILIPLAMMVLGYIFRKLILFLVVLVILFFFFNKGLDPIHYLTGIYDWLAYHIQRL